jgi:hypothetical protein
MRWFRLLIPITLLRAVSWAYRIVLADDRTGSGTAKSAPNSKPVRQPRPIDQLALNMKSHRVLEILGPPERIERGVVNFRFKGMRKSYRRVDVWYYDGGSTVLAFNRSGVDTELGYLLNWGSFK